MITRTGSVPGTEMLVAVGGCLPRRGLAGALYWPYGNPDSTPGDENPPLLHHPDYGRALREVWGSPR